MKRFLTTALILTVILPAANTVLAHCEIPCGIYNDQMRIDMIDEHITTIEKSMKMIVELGNEAKNYNQLVRWVDNKETHATEIQQIVSQYFLTQRIKSVDPANKGEFEKYTSQLRMLHEMMVAAMKCKQTTDATWVEKLRDLNQQFAASYIGEGEAHTH